MLSVPGIYTNYYGKGCQRTSRGTIGKNCKQGGKHPQRVDVQVLLNIGSFLEGYCVSFRVFSHDRQA